MLGVTGFAELTLETRDPAALARFYTEGLGLTELSRDDDRIWLAAGDSARLGLWNRRGSAPQDGGGVHVRFALAAERGALDAIARRLRGKGADVEGPLEHDSGDRSLQVRDPEGNVVEAWDLVARGSGVPRLRDGAA